MVKLKSKNQLRTEISFSEGKQFFTDGSINDGGIGEYPNPVEVLLSAIGGCILATMGGIAKQNNYDVEDIQISIDREYTQPPKRRISKLFIEIDFPFEYEKKKFTILKVAAESCIVKNSLHPDIERIMKFRFLDGTEINE